MSLPQFREYPKVLYHPHAQPAVISDDYAESARPAIGYSAPAGKAATFPPVTVNNPDQEEYYVSVQGYTPGPKPDPVAWQQQVVAPRTAPYAEYPRMRPDGTVDHGPEYRPEPGFREYPKWVTLPDGERRIVHSAEEEHRLVPPPEPSEAEREFLAAIAEAEAAQRQATTQVAMPKVGDTISLCGVPHVVVASSDAPPKRRGRKPKVRDAEVS